MANTVREIYVEAADLCVVRLRNGDVALEQFSERIVLLPDEIAPLIAALQEVCKDEHDGG
jgi:hypothetical protein